MGIQYESNPLEMRKLVLNYTDAATDKFIATVPKDCYLTICRVVIITPFNAAGSDLLKFGIGVGGSSLGINLDLSQAAGTIIDKQLTALQSSPFTTNRDMYALYTYTSTAPTAGKAIIEFGWYF